MHDSLGVDMEPEEIAAEVVRRMEALYREHLPIIDGAREAVAALSAHWRLGLASSANRQLIELVLDLASMREHFAAAVSAEEVDHGKPAPDVYLEAARRIGVQPRLCAAVEDSTNGLRAASSAGMLVVAVPNREFPPTEDALRLAQVVLESLDQLRPELLLRVGAPAR
jgi:HAD superfamily hydrolase (TIGR01509 family)